MAAGHRASAHAGARALAIVGNAVDAVIGAAFAAAVCEAPLTGLGAGGFLPVCDPTGAAALLDFFVAVPGTAPERRRLDLGELIAMTVPFGGAEQVFRIGPAAVAVPGIVQGLCAAADRVGRLPLAELFAPAIDSARAGVVVTAEAAFLHRIIAQMLCLTSDAAAVFAPGGSVLGEGDVLQVPDLAGTLEELARRGAAAMAPGGWLAETIVEQLRVLGGLITSADIAGDRVMARTSLRAAFRGRTVLTNPPPSAGGVLIAAALDDMQRRPVAGSPIGWYRNLVRAGEHANALRTVAFARHLLAPGGGSDDWATWARDAVIDRHGHGPNGTTHISALM